MKRIFSQEKITNPLVLCLPKINLKRFDEVQKQYRSDACHFDEHSSTKRYLKKPQDIQDYNKRRRTVDLLSMRSLSICQEQKISMRNKSKSIFNQKYQQLDKSKMIKKVNANLIFLKEENTKFKVDLKSIDKQSILERLYRLPNSRSEPQIKLKQEEVIKVSLITKYEDWIPKKVIRRQGETIRNENKIRIQKFEETFFSKARSRSTILKLSKFQQIKI